MTQPTATTTEKKLSFTDKMRVWFRWYYQPIAAFLNKLGIHPNTLTLVGLAGTVVGSILIAMGHMTIAGIFLLIMGPVDAMDGALARLRHEATQWGAFVDAVTDRYSELFVFFGFTVYFLAHINEPITFLGLKNAALFNGFVGVLLSYLAAAGSVLVSYVKARAQAQQLDANVGLLTRVERYIVLIPCLVFNQPLLGAFLIAVFANFTALQRIFRVRQDAYKKLSQPQE